MDLVPTIALPLLIFVARTIDVSIGTLRILFVSRGLKGLAVGLAFIEILVWLIAMTQIMTNLHSWVNYVAFAGGFAMGNYVGMSIEERLAMGQVILRIIAKESTLLLQVLKAQGFRMTVLEAEGADGPVKVIFMILHRRTLPKACRIVEDADPDAVYTIEDIRHSTASFFPATPHRRSLLARFRQSRKGK